MKNKTVTDHERVDPKVQPSLNTDVCDECNDASEFINEMEGRSTSWRVGCYIGWLTRNSGLLPSDMMRMTARDYNAMVRNIYIPLCEHYARNNIDGEFEHGDVWIALVNEIMLLRSAEYRVYEFIVGLSYGFFNSTMESVKGNLR